RTQAAAARRAARRVRTADGGAVARSRAQPGRDGGARTEDGAHRQAAVAAGEADGARRPRDAREAVGAGRRGARGESGAAAEIAYEDFGSSGGTCFFSLRCSERRCMPRRRAASEMLPPQTATTR